MSFKKYLEETSNVNGLSKEQKLVLFIGEEFENSNFKLKASDNVFNNFKNQEGKFSYDFTKDGIEYSLIVQNQKDGKFEISISNDKRSTSEEIKIDNYLKDNDHSLLTKYIKERINNIEENPSSYGGSKPMFEPNVNRLRVDRDDFGDRFNNNFVPNPHSDIAMNFANIGYDDLHGNLPNFVPGYDHYYGRPRGNLMGPEAFNLGGPGGIRYDPITPFGPGFDFIPQYDGPMKKVHPDIGFPGSNNNFGGGGYNPFI